MTNKYQFSVVVFAIWLIGLYTAGVFTGENPVETLFSVSPVALAAGLALYGAAIFTGMNIFRFSLKQIDVNVPMTGVMKAWIFGSFVDNVTPTLTPVGEATMAYFLEKFHHIKMVRTLAAVGLYVSAWTISVTMFSGISLILILLFLPVPQSYLVISTLAVAFFGIFTLGWLVLITRKSLVERIVYRLVKSYNWFRNKIKSRKVTYPLEIIKYEFDRTYSSMQVVLDNKGHVMLAALAFLIPQLAHAACIYVMILGFGVEVPFLAILLIHIISSIAGLLAFIPSGLGVYEAISVGSLLGLFNVPETVALASIFIYRLIFVWLTNFLGAAIGIKEGIKEVPQVKV